MNKSLDKLLSKVAKPVLTAAIPVVMMFAGYNSASAQELAKPVSSTFITVVLEDEQSETLNVEEKVGYGPYARYDKATRHLDILNVYHPSSSNHYSFIYPGDLSWNKGDTLDLVIDVHTDRDENGKRSRVWTDYELTENYLNETLIDAVTPDHKRYHTGVITEIKDIIPGKQ